MKYEDKKRILKEFYNFAMDEGTGMIREDDINSFLATQKHYFKPDGNDKDFCIECGKNFRNTDVHIIGKQ